jgi:hypothetical protein
MKTKKDELIEQRKKILKKLDDCKERYLFLKKLNSGSSEPCCILSVSIAENYYERFSLEIEAQVKMIDATLEMIDKL